jgi:plastocyanin
MSHASHRILIKSFVFGLLLAGLAFAGKYKEVDVKNGGSISGTVVFTGGKVDNVTASNSKDSEHCGTSIPMDRLVLGKGNGVSNTIVYLSEVKKGKKWPKKASYEIDQHGCNYTPHVLVMEKGQKLTLKNSDPLLHNVHGYLENGSTAFNVAMPLKDQTVSKKIKKDGIVEIQCDAGHTWMFAYVYSSQHPYATVTDANGNFTIDDIPEGEYELVVWHEGWNLKETDSTGRFVFEDPKEIKQKVKVSAGKSSSVKVDLK